MNADSTNSRLNFHRQGVLKILIVAIAMALLLAACERPLQSGPDDADATPPDTELPTDVAPTDVAPEEEESEDGPAAPTPTAANGPAPTEPAPTATTEQAAPEGGEEDENGDDESPRPGDEEPTPAGGEATPEEAEATPEETEATPEPTAEATEEPTAEPTAEADAGEERVHVVQAGQNLYRIGLQYGISWTELAEYNNIADPNRVEVGQEIRIPPTEGAGPEATPAPSVTHVVQPGETLFIISQQYGVSWPDIAAANDLVPPYTIQAGQELTIPGGE